MKVDLDDLGQLARLDSENVLDAVERFADQVREGWEIGRTTNGLPDARGIDSVVVLGMGGSGVSGDVTQAVVEPRFAVPFRTIKSYGPLPAWIGRNTLVFAVSYSGSTEETVAALEEAQQRGARAVAVSSGGPVAEVAERDGLAHVLVPPGQQPRASLGYLTLPLIAVLQELALVPAMEDDVDEAVAVVGELAGRCHRKRPIGENPAKQIATRIAGNVPVIYGGYGLGSTAAYRFKSDLNEYAKTPAFANEFPELNHNEIVGWNQLGELTRRDFVLVLLRDPYEQQRVALRFEVTRRLIEDQFADVIDVQAEGRSALARILSLILVTQLAAIYVGLSYGVDPGPVEVIQELKAELKAR